jgi:ketosteroid isomerase-like protein
MFPSRRWLVEHGAVEWQDVSSHNMRIYTLSLLKVFVASAVLVLVACTSLSPSVLSPEVVASQRLAHFAELLQHQDSQAIAAMFEPGGSMAHQGQPPVVGRAAIQAFLESFANFKVLSYQMHLASAVAHDGTVQQTGTYSQSVRTPDGRTFKVGGTFSAVWQQEADGRWLIQSMRTAPAG